MFGDDPYTATVGMVEAVELVIAVTLNAIVCAGVFLIIIEDRRSELPEGVASPAMTTRGGSGKRREEAGRGGKRREEAASHGRRRHSSSGSGVSDGRSISGVGNLIFFMFDD